MCGWKCCRWRWLLLSEILLIVVVGVVKCDHSFLPLLGAPHCGGWHLLGRQGGELVREEGVLIGDSEEEGWSLE